MGSIIRTDPAGNTTIYLSTVGTYGWLLARAACTETLARFLSICATVSYLSGYVQRRYQHFSGFAEPKWLTRIRSPPVECAHASASTMQSLPVQCAYVCLVGTLPAFDTRYPPNSSSQGVLAAAQKGPDPSLPKPATPIRSRRLQRLVNCSQVTFQTPRT